MSTNKPYTYHLPYSVRSSLCNLLDADRSWQTLGGHFMQLDATQLTLIGQAHLRNASPTEELLKRLDSANVRIHDLCLYLQQMNHARALQVLRSYIACANDKEQQSSNQSRICNSDLITPTPSFSDIQPAALMNSSEFDLLINSENFNNNPDDWRNVSTTQACLAIDNVPTGTRASQNLQPQAPCHKTSANNARSNVTPSSQNTNANGEEQRLSNLWRNRTKQRRGVDDKEVEEQLKLIMQIPYNELQDGSDNFSAANLLGSGGFASVYRGFWKGTHVAIKRLNSEHINQALNEFVVLNKHKIDNILPLYGLSIDGPMICLVSQFMANGSLGDRLASKNGTPPLSWELRAMISEGVARGLYFLHTVQPGKPLVHGDVKPANVLLDAQFVPKLADFGMARQMYVGNDQGLTSTHCTVSSVQGTSAYLPHEFLRNKKLSEAVDVYSYGIVMLEMATGRQAYDGKRELIHFVHDEMKGAQANGDFGPQAAFCYSLKDPRLNDDSQTTSVGLKIWYELLLRLGINCSQLQRKRRPTMGQVLNHFAQFRDYLAKSPPDTPIMNPIMDGALSLTSSTLATNTTAATSRTLTPDLTALDPHFHPLNNARAAINNEKGQQMQLLREPHSSAPMSVEEQGLNQHEQQINPNARATAVEDMIPLLTELGFESSQLH